MDKTNRITSDPTADARARYQRYWQQETMVADERGESVCLTKRSGVRDEPGPKPDRIR